jgi:hypothetical protein
MSERGSDPIGDFQRWLMKAGARSLGRDVADRVKSSVGGGSKAGVWETATTEPPGDEPPECQWCPICRAARRYRDSGGTGAGLSSQLAGVGDTLAGFTRDAFSIVEAAMRASQRPAGTPQGPSGTGRASEQSAQDNPGSGNAGSDNGTVVGPGVAWPTAVHAQDEHDETADESGDREESGESRDLPANGSGDKQVDGPAE